MGEENAVCTDGMEHTEHETSIQPDVDNLEYRPWCHDCGVFYDVDDEVIIRDFGPGTERDSDE